ncbi:MULTISPECIES: uridine kinase [Halorussus]|uniref:uridine kinase n=1 Tax=Halorussus TaxID=1070314 RepID=UPI000E213FE8|nr:MULTISPECIES: uridine kinase [Halorussus]NHN59198.1 uridine kinase [Halorussus sp. JP-T4]
MTIPSFVIGIAGGTGAGKTTVAREITEEVEDDVTRIPMDNYYKDLSHLDFEEREEVNYDHPSAFEWDLLREHMDALLSGQAIEMPQYDFSIHNRKDETVAVDPTDVIVLEGIFALYDEDVNEMLDIRVYVETDADVRILRRIERDVVDRGRDLEGVIDQYLSTVKPMHEQFVAPTKKRADLIIPEGANAVAVNLLEEKVRAETLTDSGSGWTLGEEGVEREDADRLAVTGPSAADGGRNDPAFGDAERDDARGADADDRWRDDAE